jgi:hypothetical protein
MVDLLIILIIVVVVMGYVFKLMAQSVKLPRKQSIYCFTGTLGSGKTFLATRKALQAYRSQRLKHDIYTAFKWLPKRDKIFKSWKYPATFYSNIPVRLGRDKISIPLTKADLLERGRLPEKCVVFIDEIGAVASQWDYNNPFVCEQLEKFIRFFRHWLDGKMFCTDQVADNIVKPIRSRLGIVYNLHDFRRVKILPLYRITAIPLLMVDSNASTASTTADKSFNDVYFCGFLPYRNPDKRKIYQSRCYKPIYKSSAVRDITAFDDSLYTNYLIDLSVSDSVSRDYQRNRDKYKDYLYTASDRSSKLNECNEFAQATDSSTITDKNNVDIVVLDVSDNISDD